MLKKERGSPYRKSCHDEASGYQKIIHLKNPIRYFFLLPMWGRSANIKFIARFCFLTPAELEAVTGISPHIAYLPFTLVCFLQPTAHQKGSDSLNTIASRPADFIMS